MIAGAFGSEETVSCGGVQTGDDKTWGRELNNVDLQLDKMGLKVLTKRTKKRHLTSVK